MTTRSRADSAAPPPSIATERAVEAGKGALFIGFAKVFFMISGFLQRWLLTRFVSAADYGAFSVVNNAVSMVNNAVVQATSQAVSKFTAEDDARVDAVKRAGLRIQALVGTAIALGFLLAAPLVAAAVHAPEYVNWFRLVSAIPFLYGFYSVFVGSANGLRRFRTQASFDVGFSTAKTVLVLGGALALRGFGGPEARGAVTGAFLGFVAAAAIILIVAAKTMGLPSRSATGTFSASRLLAFMVGVGVYALLVNVALNYDLPLLRRFARAATTAVRADVLAGNYEALRNLALLPYQALIVVTFVVFPLVSRSTFDQDREATRSYVGQTLRLALIVAGGMGVALAARPRALLAVLYKPEYQEGAAALPVLVGGICCLSVLAVACAIINAAGRPRVSSILVGVTVAVGSVLAFALVRTAEPGAAMLTAMATATSAGMAAGLVAAVLYLQRRFGAGAPAASVLRVVGAALVSIALARFVPGSGKLVGLAAIALATLCYGAALVLSRELGRTDWEKVARILGRRTRAR